MAFAHLASARADFTAADFLRANGPVLRRENGAGAIVTLRGTNLGGWFVQEPWMCPTGTGRPDRTDWTAEVDHHVTAAAIDGHAATTVTVDSGGLTTTFGRWQAFDAVVLESPVATGMPVDWKLSVRANDNAWRDIAVKRIDRIGSELRLQLADGVTARAVRIRRSAPQTWPVAEINLEQADDYTVRGTLARRFGPAKADELLRVYQEHWITSLDLDELQRWGMNVVRVPINWLDFLTEAGEWKPRAWERLDWLLQACEHRGLYVILDLHAVPGGASPWASSGRAGDDGSGQNPNGFWSNPKFQALAAKLWTGVAARYRHRAVVAGYDLVNEPVYRFDEAVGEPGRAKVAIETKAAMFDRLYRSIRAVDPEHLVIIEAFTTLPSSAQDKSDFDGITAPAVHGWTNVMYQTHHYAMEHAEDREAQRRLVDRAIREIVEHQRSWNIPVYAGEFCLYDFPDVWRRWLGALNAAHVSWTNWTYKVRAGAGVPGGGNWGYFHGYHGPIPDVTRDPADAIARAWAGTTTESFERNDRLIGLVSEFTHD